MTYGSGYTYGGKVLCDHDPTPILASKMASLIVSAVCDTSLIDPNEVALVINLTAYENFKTASKITINAQAEKILPKKILMQMKQVELPTIRVDVPDYSTPQGLSRNWWRDLAKFAESLTGSVVVCCQGGHGRSGMVASIIAGYWGIQGDTVEWIREEYCDQAVETQTQSDYVAWALGRNFKSAPPTKYGKYTGGQAWEYTKVATETTARTAVISPPSPQQTNLPGIAATAVLSGNVTTLLDEEKAEMALRQKAAYLAGKKEEELEKLIPSDPKGQKTPVELSPQEVEDILSGVARTRGISHASKWQDEVTNADYSDFTDDGIMVTQEELDLADAQLAARNLSDRQTMTGNCRFRF